MWALMTALGPVIGASAADRIRTARGTETGEIIESSPLELTIDKGSSGKRQVAVNEIRSVTFDDEPADLAQARIVARNGGYRAALEKLRGIDPKEVKRDLVQEEVGFYQAYCTAKLALAGDGEIVDAGRQLNDFVRNHPQNFHYLEAVETMGDLLMASDKYRAAQRQYAEIAKAPWPDFKIRAGVLLGRTLQAQGKHDEAIRQFDSVLATTDDTDASKNAKLSATLGKATSLAETGRVEEAVTMIEQVIQNADPEQKELQARAYNALGDCYQRGGKVKDALLAYLHVDVLYSTVPDAHAEALAHLVPLWQAIGQEARARESRQTLNERYAGSPWAQ